MYLFFRVVAITEIYKGYFTQFEKGRAIAVERCATHRLFLALVCYRWRAKFQVKSSAPMCYVSGSFYRRLDVEPVW